MNLTRSFRVDVISRSRHSNKKARYHVDWPFFQIRVGNVDLVRLPQNIVPLDAVLSACDEAGIRTTMRVLKRDASLGRLKTFRVGARHFTTAESLRRYLHLPKDWELSNGEDAGNASPAPETE
jgi:hypothetical protein